MSDYKKIILKNSPVAGAVPLEDFLDFGELALNYADNKLYYKELGGGIVVHETPYLDVEGSQNSVVKRNGDGSGVFNGVISNVSDPDLYALDISSSASTTARVSALNTQTAINASAVSGIGANINSTSGIGSIISSGSSTAAVISSNSSTYHAEFGNIATNNSSAIERIRGAFVWFYNTFKGRLQTSNITADRNWTLPDRSGTLATTDNLSQFASTTSEQLAVVISDETGSGSLVFATSPTLTTPTIGTINGSTVASGTLTLRSTSNTTKGTAGVLLTDDIASSSSTTGSLVVTGGVGISEDIYAGGNVYANNQILATKNYVDTLAEGLHVHAAVHVILNTSLENITGGSVAYDNVVAGVGAYLTLSNPINFTTGLEGDTDLAVGSRIIVNGQSQALRNGIYTITSTTRLTRAEDFDTPLAMAGGDFVFVTHGSTYSNTGWVLGEAVPSVGVSPVNFIQFSGAGTPIAGAGLTTDGLILNVGGTSGRITVNTDSIDLASSGVTPNTYRSVTVDTYGRVTSGSNPTTLAGYGITDDYSINGHAHAISDITNLQTSLDDKLNKVATLDSSITGSGKTFTNLDDGKIFHITGTNTCTLPSYSSANNGWTIGFVNVGGSAITFNVAGGSGNTINDGATFSNTVKWSSVYIYKSNISGKFIAIGILY